MLPLIGAKEGIGHAAFCFLDPGDLALVPDPAYPVYGVGTMFAGAESHVMPLYESNGWLPELDAIPSDAARAAKLMWLNYPNNPTSAIGDPGRLRIRHSFLHGKRHRTPPRRRIQRSRLRRLPSWKLLAGGWSEGNRP